MSLVSGQGFMGVSAHWIECQETSRPLTTPFEAGAFFLWMTEEAVHVLLRPEIYTDDQRCLHCETGPALRWEDGSGLYFWHGIRVPAQVILRPQALTLQQILQEEVRARGSARGSGQGVAGQGVWSCNPTSPSGGATLECCNARPDPAALDNPGTCPMTH